MFNHFSRRWVLAALLSCAALGNTSSVRAAEPLTLTTAAQENKMGEDAYKDVLAKEKICKDPATVAFVEGVARKICAAAPDKGFKYEISVLESPTVNAFCLPGGKICVYTGILPYCQNEAGLATVLGHETAHAILRHGGQRMTEQTVSSVAGSLFQKALEYKGVSASTEQISMIAFNYGSQLGYLLPYSRSQESEADENGLMYMAKAGYDPAEAPAFWQRFSALNAGSAPPQIMSTHPSDASRVAHMTELQPSAKRLYEQSARIGAGAPVPASALAIAAAQAKAAQKAQGKTAKTNPPAAPAPATPPASAPTAAPAPTASTPSTGTVSTIGSVLSNISLSDLGLSDDELGRGVKQAIAQGYARAINTLGKQDGFLKDAAVKIVVPEQLKDVEKGLRLVGKDALVDDFVSNMNRAAEKAVPDAAGIFAGALANLTVNDARGLIKGPPDAVTSFFNKNCREKLEAQFKPEVVKATEASGATSSYKKLVKKAGFAASFLLGNFDVDQYVTTKAVDGLFLKMADEEKAIRANPAGQASDLLKKVFGAK